MVIFGAGASYDSAIRPPGGPEEIFRPPLTKELFNDGHRPWIRGIIDSLRYIRPLSIALDELGQKDNFEIALEQWSTKHPNKDQAARGTMAMRFYLQRVLLNCSNEWMRVTNGKTNYLKLLTLLDAWRSPRKESVNLVTFNYDTLLDDACIDALDMTPKSISDYTKRSDFRLYKLHGSINWGRVMSNNLGLPDHSWDAIAQKSITLAPKGLDLTGEYRIIRPETLFDGIYMLPAIAIPLQDKAGFECPESHQMDLSSSLPHVSQIVIIGWRGTEKHFLSMIRTQVDPHVRVLVINGNRSAAEFTKSVMESLGIRNVTTADYGFSDFVTLNKNLDAVLS